MDITIALTKKKIHRKNTLLDIVKMKKTLKYLNLLKKFLQCKYYKNTKNKLHLTQKNN